MDSLASQLSLPVNASFCDLGAIGEQSVCTDKTLSSPSSTHVSRDQKNAILVLQKSSTETGDSVYDHMVDIIKKIIVERPKNVVDYFEDFSRQIRQERYRSDERTQRGFYQNTHRMDVSAKILAGLTLNTERLFLTNSFVNEFMERYNHWSSAGIGFSHEKQIRLMLSMQRLLTNSIVRDARFWGTIYGIEKNYHIAEATLTRVECENRLSMAEDTLLEMELRETQTTLKSSIIGETPSNAELRTKIQDVIKCQHRSSDLNGQVFFVCNEFDAEWIELPSVTPEEVVQSRKIQKYCRGNLENSVRSYPPFLGTEKNYLRALIARISHGTTVKPIATKMNDLIFENLLDVANWMHAYPEINADGSIEQIVANPSTEADSNELSVSNTNSTEQLMDANGEGSSKIESLILNERTSSRASANAIDQTRLSTVNENGNSVSDDGIDNSETASTVQSKTTMPKTCADDYFDDRIRPWNITPVDNYCVPDATIVADSVIWNGSFTLATRKFVDHIYIGWGQKMTTMPIVPSIQFITEDENTMPDLECIKPKYE